MQDKNKLEKWLSGCDLRSLGDSHLILNQIQSQDDFDNLFTFLFHHNRGVVMRAADVIEKITILHPEYLVPHNTEVMHLASLAQNKELKWHLALILSRLNVDTTAFKKVWNLLSGWALDNKNSLIVRVNSLQGLFDLQHRFPVYKPAFVLIMNQLESEAAPSVRARIAKLKHKIEKNQPDSRLLPEN